MPHPARVLTKLKELTKVCDASKYLVNRNPRNLERLRIAYKPSGYHLEQPGRSFWHKLELTSSGRYVTAKLVHFENGPVVEASTSEWAIKKQLPKTKDYSAYVNLGRVFAQRCLESGLTEMVCSIKSVPDGKIDKFLNVLKENGVRLTESERFMPHRPWNVDRPEKPWEIQEN